MRFWIDNFMDAIDNTYATLWLDRKIDILNCSYKSFYITIYQGINNKKRVIFRLPFSIVPPGEGKPNFEKKQGGYSYRIKTPERIRRININIVPIFSHPINFINNISYMYNNFDIDYKYGDYYRSFSLNTNISGTLTVRESFT